MATTTPAGVRGDAKHAGRPPEGHRVQMSHRQIMEALTGILLGMFVAILSSTIVSNALPHIIHDLGGGESAYTWVVTAALLSMTATTPLWGKLADLFSKKLLVQLALIIYVLASAAAGLAQNSAWLIACRVAQGVGTGGLSAMAQIVMAAMIAPRERGRYSGYIGATFAVATVGGPLLGGVITDTSWLGWRWCFYVGVPFAVIALIVLQKTLHLPVIKRENVKVDWAGAFFITAGVCLLLLWVSFAGDKYDWLSWQTGALVGGAVVLLLLFVLVEAKAKEPIVPMRLFRNPTISLASLASLFVGIAMFSGTIFFSQYFQLARGKTPTMSGVMTIPMIAGLFLASTISGQIITRWGRWKPFLVSGAFLVTAGLGLLGTIRYDTPYWRVGIFMALLGIGVGMTMQNLVLCTQNQVKAGDLGSASSMVTFFRSLGGAMGVSTLGAVMATRIGDYLKDGLAGLGPKFAAMAKSATGGSSDSIPDMNKVPQPLRSVIEGAYGHGIADIFLIAAGGGLIAFLVVLFIKEVPLSTKGGLDRTDDNEDAEGAENAARVEEATLATIGAPAVTEAGSAGTAVAAAAVAAPVATAAATTGGPGIPVRGSVRGSEGAAVPQATVTLISLGGRQLGRAVAQADGSYAVDAPGAGTYFLIASADGFQPQASTVVVGDVPLTYDLLLSGTSGLKGVVRAAGTGQPVRDAMVMVTDVRGDVLATGSTAEDGEFSFDELVPGPATVAVNASGFRPRAHSVEIGNTGVTRLEVELDAGARVTGAVRAPHGPLRDALVTLVDAAGNVVATTTTGEDGAYAFTDLDRGEYTLIATGYPPTATALSLSDRGLDGHDIDLAHPDQ